MLLSEAQIEQFLKLELAIDGSSGGLIIGPSHEEGGIQVYWHMSDGYKHWAEFEGWEYLLNPGASVYYKNTFQEINKHDQDKTEFFQEYSVLPNVRLLDCRIKPELALPGMSAKIIILKGTPQNICNKYSTKLHLEKLNNMNRGMGYRYDNDDPRKARKLMVIQADNEQVVKEFPIIQKDE